MRPIEMRTGVHLATGRDIGMADDIFDRIVVPQDSNEPRQHVVLPGFERPVVATLQFDADREVVAVFGAVPTRRTGMPGTQGARDELHDAAIPPDQEVCGDAKRMDLPVIGMRLGIQRVAEQALDAVPAELPWRQ